DVWVVAEVEVNGSGVVRHKVDGETVMEYEKPQYDLRDADAKKLVKDEKNLLIGEGYLALQAEDDPIESRKAEVRVARHEAGGGREMIAVVCESDIRFVIAESTVPGAGRGLFARIPLEPGEVLPVTGVLVEAGSVANDCTRYADAYKFRVGEGLLLIPVGY